jgi:hypothetical protein
MKTGDSPKSRMPLDNPTNHTMRRTVYWICQMCVINCFGRTCTSNLKGSFSPHQRRLLYSYRVLISVQLGDAEIYKCRVFLDVSEEQSREQSRGAGDVRLDHARMFRVSEQSQAIAPARSPDCQTRNRSERERPGQPMSSKRSTRYLRNSSMYQSEQSVPLPLLTTITSLLNPSVIVARFPLSTVKQISFSREKIPEFPASCHQANQVHHVSKRAKLMSSVFQPVSAYLNMVRIGELQTACVVESVLPSAGAA